METIWVIGGGGHAKVVIATLLAAGEFHVAGVLDDDPTRRGDRVLGVEILGDTKPATLARYEVDRAVIAIGSNATRAAVAERCGGRLTFASAVHPRAYVAPGVNIGEGTVIFAGAIVQPNTTVGRHTVLNTACSVDHDSVLGDFTHIAPGARLAGGVRVGAGSLIGLGAVLLPGRSVGSWATVGAGSVVARDVSDRTVVKGVPARSEKTGV
jgi:sugar O-acyltransferase (sialic acid O-acetyltransferase NeuD family)